MSSTQARTHGLSDAYAAHALTGALGEEASRCKDASPPQIEDAQIGALMDDCSLPVIMPDNVVEELADRAASGEQQSHSSQMETLGILAGGITHDFNNTLQVIVGWGELARGSLPHHSPAKRHLERILNAAKQATELSAQILAFSCRRKAERRPTSLAEVAKEALTLLRATLPKTIEIEERIDATVELVLADAGCIHHALVNLGINALHAMRGRRGVLTMALEEVVIDAEEAKNLGVKPEGAYARLSVGDTGHGLDGDTIPHIYEPFFTTKQPGDGTGLGLSMVREVVLDHGGAISLATQPGVGTTFHLYFPTIDAVTPEEADHPSADEVAVEHVLFVDDDEDIALIVKQLLKKRGITVTAKTDSMQALQRFRSAPDDFDLVITDQTMPGLTGLELAKELRKIRPNMPVILVSGYGDQSAKLPAGNEISAVVQKPFRGDELVSVLRRTLAASRANQPLQATVLRFADVELDRLERSVTRSGSLIALTPIEFKLLEALMGSPESVVCPEALRRQVWGMEFDPKTATLRVHMSNLRAKLAAGSSPGLIATVPGRGYKMS